MDPTHCDKCYKISRTEFVAKWCAAVNKTVDDTSIHQMVISFGLDWLFEHCYSKPTSLFEGHVTVVEGSEDCKDYMIRVDEAGAEAILRWFEEDVFKQSATFLICDETEDPNFQWARVYVMNNDVRSNVASWTARYIGYQMGMRPSSPTREAWIQFLTKFKISLTDSMFLYLCKWGFMQPNQINR